MNRLLNAPFSRRRALAMLAATGVAAVARAQDAPGLRLASPLPGATAFGSSQVAFASPDIGQRVLTTSDDWLAATSAFQRRAVMVRQQAVTLDDFLAWHRDAVKPWPSDLARRWHQALQPLVARFAALRIPLPDQVWLVSTNGQDSAQAPYTRGAAVVMPQQAELGGESDSFVMAHELWHVASRHAPALATRLYAALGFEPMPLLAWPQAWADVRLANPDAPDNRHAMRLTLADGRQPWVTPVLVAARTQLKPGESFFSVMQVRLLEVSWQPGDALAQAVLQEGLPVWHPLNGRHNYLQQLGGNTGYIIHPEEAMADNIALLVMQGQARNPALLARLQAILAA